MTTVIVCDDSDFMRDKVVDTLAANGYKIIDTAKSGAEAVMKYKQKKPDLLMMDIIMSDNGVDAIKKIMEFDPKARIVVVSILDGNQADMIEAIHLGAKGYVAKPIKAPVLLDEVKRVLGTV